MSSSLGAGACDSAGAFARRWTATSRIGSRRLIGQGWRILAAGIQRAAIGFIRRQGT